MTEPERVLIQTVTYHRLVRPPTLKQWIYRKAVAELMVQVKGETGTDLDPETGRLAPASAIKAKELMKGLNAEKLIAEHPDWVKEYETTDWSKYAEDLKRRHPERFAHETNKEG